jgi:hypothetical protein
MNRRTKKRVDKPEPDAYALDWFITFKKLPQKARRATRYEGVSVARTHSLD